jgi:hypothetical protein
MTLHDRVPSVGVPPLPPVTTRSGRLALVCSRSAPQLSLTPSALLLTASGAAVALPPRTMRLRDRTCGSIPTIGSSPQTR